MIPEPDLWLREFNPRPVHCRKLPSVSSSRRMLAVVPCLGRRWGLITLMALESACG